jgi:hypothetical protein
MTIDFHWLYGMAVGLVIAERDYADAVGLEWGFSLMLGPFCLVFEKEVEEE